MSLLSEELGSDDRGRGSRPSLGVHEKGIGGWGDEVKQEEQGESGSCQADNAVSRRSAAQRPRIEEWQGRHGGRWTNKVRRSSWEGQFARSWDAWGKGRKIDYEPDIY